MHQVLFEKHFPGGFSAQVVHGDLLQEPVEAIVNAANEHLQHGGGVAGAIRVAGGRQIQLESDAWVQTHGPVSHAQPAYTGAGELPFRYIIHAVGPYGGDPQRAEKLAAAVRGSLELGEQLGVSSLALPALSTGIFGYALEAAMPVIWQAICGYAQDHPGGKLQLVRVTLLGEEDARKFAEYAGQDQTSPRQH